MNQNVLEGCRVTLGKELAKCDKENTSIVTIGDTPIVSIGNIAAIAGNKDFRRRYVLLSLACSALLNDKIYEKNMVFRCDNKNNDAVVYINTEPGLSYYEDELRASLACAGMNKVPANLFAYHLHLLPFWWKGEDVLSAVRAATKKAHAECFGVKIILVDGYETIIGNGRKNRIEKANNIISELKNIASYYNTAIVLTVHNGRGLSELRNKCESVLKVDDDNLRFLGEKKALASVWQMYRRLGVEIRKYHETVNRRQSVDN